MLRSERLWIGVFLAAIMAVGCGKKESDPWMIRLAGREIPLSQVTFEFDRINGVDQWKVAKPEVKRDFLDTFARKELLVQKARDTYGPLPQREQMIYDRWLEKQVNGFYWLNYRSSIEVPAAYMDSLAQLCSQQRYLRHTVCTYEEDAREIADKIKAGASYDEVSQAYNARDPKAVIIANVGWVSRPDLHPAIGDVLFGLPAAGAVGGPTESPYGWHVILCDSIRAIDPEQARAKAEEKGTEVYRRDVVSKRVADLEKQYNFEVLLENVGPLQRGFQAMYDSLDAAKKTGVTLDYQALPPPIHRFSAEELALPLVRWSGGVMTLGDFVNTLWKIDLDYWPTIGDAQKYKMQIKRRMTRWAFVEEAKKAGTFDDPSVLRDARRKQDELYLDRFHNDRLKVFADKVTEDDVRAYWATNSQKYTSRDLVAYGFIRFPGDALELAQRCAGMIKSGSEWGVVATGARRQDARVEFQDDLDPTDGPPFPEITAVAMGYEPLGPKQPLVTDPLKIGDDWVILRVNFRSRPSQLTYETAKEYVWRDLQRLAMEDTLVAWLDNYKNEYKLKINTKAI